MQSEDKILLRLSPYLKEYNALSSRGVALGRCNELHNKIKVLNFCRTSSNFEIKFELGVLERQKRIYKEKEMYLDEHLCELSIEEFNWVLS